METLSPQQYARQRARKLRKTATEAEKILWRKLRNKQFMGYKFLFQHPVFYTTNNRIKFFIADFYCHRLLLIIEVDGGIHEQQKEYDKIRTELLVNKKYKLIRFSNEEVQNNINKVLIDLKKEVNKIIKDDSEKNFLLNQNREELG